MTADNELRSECDRCGRTIWRYCHTEAGPLRAYAWTDVSPEDESDPRYGIRCGDHLHHDPSLEV